jgi:hypothetical protein
MTEETGFPSEPTFNLAALAGQEQLHERIRELENERAGKVREALLSLAAELEAEADGLLAGRNTGLMDRLTAPSAAVCFRAAARMARLRAGVDVDAPEHASESHGIAQPGSGAPEGAQARGEALLP